MHEYNDNYTIDEVKLFFDGMKFLLFECTLGYNVPYNEELVRYVPYLRALDYLRVFSEKRLD